MFETLELLPPDPILGLGQQYQDDPNPNKVGLSVGVYQNEAGQTPVLEAVRRAEQTLFAAQQTKSYIAQAGDPAFLAGIARLLLGPVLDGVAERVAVVQAPGGCGALRIAAEVVNEARPGATLWVSDPTWANHFPLLSAAGLRLENYPFYDTASSTVRFDAMLEALRRARPGDLVLLHASCHNPTGAELAAAQWDTLISLCAERGLVPFIDSAYQGFGESLDADAYGMREAVKRLPEVVIASSCSKNFGLYRERTGAMLFIGANAPQTQAARSHALTLARRSYTMAPYHGAGIVGAILADSDLQALWIEELDGMRQRINGMRRALVDALNARQVPRDFSFIAEQRGMFSYLGVSRRAVAQLRSEYAIYLLDSTRINVAGLTTGNVDYVADAIAEVLGRRG